jgi:hypothetical protein
MTFVFGLRLCKIKWDVVGFGLISVTLGYACSHLHYLQLDDPLPEAWHGQEAWLEGEVDGFPYRDQEGAWHLKLIRVQKCDHEDRHLAIAGVLQVTWTARTLYCQFRGTESDFWEVSVANPGGSILRSELAGNSIPAQYCWPILCGASS